jgi:hypothetical protein
LEHRASNVVSIKHLNATGTSATASDGKLLRLYIPENEEEEEEEEEE